MRMHNDRGSRNRVSIGPRRQPQWDVALRAGYWSAQKAIPDATYNPAIPDGDSHAISVGFGLFCRGGGHFFGIIPCGDSEKALRPKGIGLDLVYKAILYEIRTINGNINPMVDGTYRTTLHVGSINLRMNF